LTGRRRAIMGQEIRNVIIYSQAFKQKVLKEIENGKYSISQARMVYDIRGKMTIQKWIKKIGKNELLGKRVRIEMRTELDKIKQLQEEKKELEKAVSKLTLKNLALETQIEILEEESGIDSKKKLYLGNQIE
jgi:transposase-like protein